MSLAADVVQVPEGPEEEAHGSHQEAAQGGECLMYLLLWVGMRIANLSFRSLFRSARALCSPHRLRCNI
jgi:hypothetical protein